MSKIISQYWACWRSVIMRGLEGLYNNNNKKKWSMNFPRFCACCLKQKLTDKILDNHLVHQSERLLLTIYVYLTCYMVLTVSSVNCPLYMVSRNYHPII